MNREENEERLNPQRMEYSDPPQRLPPKMPLIGNTIVYFFIGLNKTRMIKKEFG